MYQIDWGVRGINFVNGLSPFMKSQKRSLTIAAFFSVQILAMVMRPMLTNAETHYSSASLTEDAPEEVLRAEIYTDARSPIDGKQLSAAEYVELMEKLRSLDNIPPEDLVSPKVREVIDLLKLRKFLRQFIPFIP